MTGRPRLAASNERVAESESVVEPKCSGGTHVETIRKVNLKPIFSIQPFNYLKPDALSSHGSKRVAACSLTTPTKVEEQEPQAT